MNLEIHLVPLGMKIQWRLALAGLFILANAVADEVETPEPVADALPAVEEHKDVAKETPAEKGPELQDAAAKDGVKELIERNPRHSASYRENRDRDYEENRREDSDEGQWRDDRREGTNALFDVWRNIPGLGRASISVSPPIRKSSDSMEEGDTEPQRGHEHGQNEFQADRNRLQDEFSSREHQSQDGYGHNMRRNQPWENRSSYGKGERDDDYGHNDRQNGYNHRHDFQGDELSSRERPSQYEHGQSMRHKQTWEGRSSSREGERAESREYNDDKNGYNHRHHLQGDETSSRERPSLGGFGWGTIQRQSWEGQSFSRESGHDNGHGHDGDHDGPKNHDKYSRYNDKSSSRERPTHDGYGQSVRHKQPWEGKSSSREGGHDAGLEKYDGHGHVGDHDGQKKPGKYSRYNDESSSRESPSQVGFGRSMTHRRPWGSLSTSREGGRDDSREHNSDKDGYNHRHHLQGDETSSRERPSLGGFGWSTRQRPPWEGQSSSLESGHNDGHGHDDDHDEQKKPGDLGEVCLPPEWVDAMIAVNITMARLDLVTDTTKKATNYLPENAHRSVDLDGALDKGSLGRVDLPLERVDVILIADAMLTAGAITTDKMTAGEMTADKMTAGQMMTAGEMAGDKVTTGEMTADKMTAEREAFKNQDNVNNNGNHDSRDNESFRRHQRPSDEISSKEHVAESRPVDDDGLREYRLRGSRNRFLNEGSHHGIESSGSLEGSGRRYSDHKGHLSRGQHHRIHSLVSPGSQTVHTSGGEGRDDSTSSLEMKLHRRGGNDLRRTLGRTVLENFVRESISRAGDILESLRSVDRLLSVNKNDQQDNLERRKRLVNSTIEMIDENDIPCLSKGICSFMASSDEELGDLGGSLYPLIKTFIGEAPPSSAFAKAKVLGLHARDMRICEIAFKGCLATTSDLRHSIAHIIIEDLRNLTVPSVSNER
ncbi:unnamed protein product [Darwinula stevensoni]|uniref:Uncharacterized protein n=1 Tax=Darwinula stevensoni TaxID=69355 RepID=A0A7R8WYM0_9CRUS|nr:unnamed protein product [Darwinula stevensoni]CAG0879571.1 unnamed protein product [Darwinula stevensoni]